MPVTGLIEQAPRNAYYMSDALGGDILLRSLCNNSWIFGDGSNTTSTLRINKNMISSTANTFTHTGFLGVSNLTPQYTLDVAGDINFTGILRQNGSAYVGSQWSNNSNNVFLMNSNVGIGTNSPQFNLHVPGTIATSNLRVNNLTGTGSTINIGTDSNTSTINIGGTNSTVNLIGSLSYITATDLTVADKRITLNKNGASATAGDSGIEIEEGGTIRAYIKTSTDRNSFLFRTPNGSNDLTLNLINNAANFNNNLLVLNSNSRVGVGTSNPAYTFEVQGVINATSNILVNGQSLQAGYWFSAGTPINWTQSNVVIGTSSNPTGMRLYLAGTGTTNSGGTGDMVNVTSNLMTLFDTNFPRIVHRSGDASISTVYNFESNKNVYWGETADSGYYSFRGRGLALGYTTIPTSNYRLDVNGTANISDRLLVTNNIGIGTTNASEKMTISAGNVALVHGGTYGNNGSSDKWISMGDRTQTLAPQFQQSNYGLTMTWDTDGCFFGLRDFGSGRKDTVLSFGDDTTDNLRFMYSNSADYMTITGTGNVGIGRSNPTYRLDVNGDINFTGTLRSNGVPFVGGGGGASGWSNNSSNVFVIGSNVGIGTSTPCNLLHVTGNVQFDSNIIISNNSTIGLRGLLISKRLASGTTGSLVSTVTSVPGYTYTSNVVIQSASTCNIQLLSSNVGIGRSNPSYALDVLGDINFSGTFRQNGTPYVGSQWSNSGANVFITGSNVGIGTTTPSFALDVGGTVNLSNSPLRIPGGSNCILFQNADPGDMIVRAYTTAGDRYGMGQYTSGITRLFAASSFASATVRISGATNDTRTGSAGFNDYMTVLTGGGNAGRVGIGTTSPGFTLDVAGDINLTGTFRQNGTQYVASQWSNNGSQIFINGSNVAIGKTSASTALDVQGTVSATSFTEGGVALSSKYLQATGASTFSTSNVYAGSNDSSNLPGYSWTNDTGTGMYRPSLCNIALATGGIERFRMTSNGNIGINRTTPGYLLDVNGALNGVTIFENASPLTTRYAQSNMLSNYMLSNAAVSQFALSNQLSNYALSNDFTTFSNWTNTQYARSNQLSNYVLSNTAFAQFAPSNQLSNYALSNTVNTINTNASWASNNITFRWNSSNAFITGSNVGINTNTPARALHVAGDIQVDSNLLLGGVIGVQGLQINRRTGGIANVIASPAGYSWDSNITLTAATNSNINLSGNVRAQNSSTAGIRMGNTNSNIDGDAVVQLAGVANTRTTLASYQAALTEQTHIAINNTAGRVGTITSENSNVNYYGISQGAYITLGSNSNIGIITKTPTYTLEVSGNRVQALRATGCNASGNYLPTCLLENTASNNPAVLGVLAPNVSSNTGNNAVSLYLGQSTGIGNATQLSYSHFGNNNTSNMFQVAFWGSSPILTVANNSNVGIGTTSLPLYRLDVNGTTRVNSANALNNKLLVLWDGGASDAVATACNFFGFGINSDTLRYQVSGLNMNHMFYTNTTARMLIGSNVGIGTSTPAFTLTLGNAGAATTGQLHFNTADGDRLFMTANGLNGSKISHLGNWGMAYYAGPSNSLAGYHNFYTGTASGYTQLVTMSNGQVGIGTTTPVSLLNVNGTTDAVVLTGGTNPVSMTLSNSGGRAEIGLAAATDNFVSGTIAGDMVVRNTRTTGKVIITAGNANTYFTVNSNSACGFNTTAPVYTVDINGSLRVNSTNVAPRNKLLVLWDGNATDNWDTATNFYGFGINGGTLRYQVVGAPNNHSFFCGSTEYFRINSSGQANPSDIRLKSDIVDLTDALDKINAMQGKTFLMKGDPQRQMGFIAQEVLDIVPEVVRKDDGEDGFYFMSYDKLTALLAEGIKELDAKLKQKDDEIKNLNDKLDEISRFLSAQFPEMV